MCGWEGGKVGRTGRRASAKVLREWRGVWRGGVELGELTRGRAQRVFGASGVRVQACDGRVWAVGADGTC